MSCAQRLGKTCAFKKCHGISAIVIQDGSEAKKRHHQGRDAVFGREEKGA